MMPPIDQLEVRATAMSRNRIRRGLQLLDARGVPIGWSERGGWWRCVFLIWGHPALIRLLEARIGYPTVRPLAPRGRHLNTIV